MSKINVSFEIEISKLPDLEAFLNGGKSKKKAAASDDDDLDFMGDDDEESEDEESEDEITTESMLEAIKLRTKAGKAEIVKKLLAKHKVKTVSGLKTDEQKSKFMSDLEKIKVK